MGQTPGRRGAMTGPIIDTGESGFKLGSRRLPEPHRPSWCLTAAYHGGFRCPGFPRSKERSGMSKVPEFEAWKKAISAKADVDERSLVRYWNSGYSPDDVLLVFRTYQLCNARKDVFD